MKDIEFTVHVHFTEEEDSGDDFKVRLTGITEDYGFDSDYLQEEAEADFMRQTEKRFVIPVMLTPGYNPRFEGVALYELHSYQPSTERGIRGVITYQYETTAG